jgi:hypothetical protein
VYVWTEKGVVPGLSVDAAPASVALCTKDFEHHLIGETTMRHFFMSLGVALVLFALSQTAQAAVIVNQVIPISITVFVPCANGGAGEDVALTGNLHDMFELTFDNAGGVHVKFQDNPQGISGVGSVTGDRYQGTGVTQVEFNAKVGVEVTFINRFDIIGQGPGNNFEIHETAHLTVNANGTLTVFFDNFSAVCK